MATAHFHRLKGNVQNAINYIMNKDKTLSHLIEAKNCNMFCAGIEWNLKNNNGKRKKSSIDDVIGYHFHLNFEANTVSPEQAFEITKEWIESYTKGDHDYVIATHIDHLDKGLVHTHVIVNPYCNKKGTHWNLYLRKALPEIRKLSDDICKKYGLKTLNQDIPSKNNNYYSWMMQEQGDNHKDIIKKAISNLVPQVKDYSEFKQYLIKLGFRIEDGTEDGNNRKGLRIMVPNGRKFIRCNNIIDDNGFSLSYKNIIEIINKNGIFVTKKNVKEFIEAKETQKDKIDNRNKFYEECKIKVPYKASIFNKLTPQEKMYFIKKQIISSLLNEIHETNIIISSIEQLAELKEIKIRLQININDVSKQLKYNEKQFETVIQQRMDGILEISDNEIDSYVNTRIVPYRKDKSVLQMKIKEISDRINKAETLVKNNKNNELAINKER